LLLERISRDLFGKANAAAFLPEVEQDAAALLLQKPQTVVQLFSAVTTRRPEDITRQTFRVHTNQNRPTLVDRSQGEHHVFFALGCFVDEHLEDAVTSRKARPGNPPGG
jgi:hypothetical protein